MNLCPSDQTEKFTGIPLLCMTLFKRHLRQTLVLFALLVFSGHSHAQSQKEKAIPKTSDTLEDFYSDAYLRYENHVYKKFIQTVQLINKAAELSSPMIRFNSDDQLLLSFDDLDADLKTYSYSLVQCNADWTPSDLVFSEYANGFTDNPIPNYAYSSSMPAQKYIHYSLYFPNENMIILKPGNYLLKVYLDNNPDNIAITRRFLVYENSVFIKSELKSGASLTDQRSKQGIDFSIQYGSYDIRNPMDLKVVLLQNDRWDNAISGIKPVFLKDREASYEFGDAQNEFNGGSEFRNFDIKSIRFRSEHISEIRHEENGTQVYLLPDESRATQRYSTIPDINGRFLVRIQEGINSDIDADYCYVHFSLAYPDEEKDANFYVLGALSNWSCNSLNRLKYNSSKKAYEACLYLKQGYYNYEYVKMADGNGPPDENQIEGSHAETENEYTILVYYRSPANSYDRLIAVKKLNSTKY
jgi:hypothetical protein